MDKFEDKQANHAGADSSQPGQEAEVDQSRRRFSRAALASGAVVLSLGNRAAWGQDVAGCMSIMTLNSFHPDTQMFTSSPAGRPEHDINLASAIHRVGGAPNYLGREGDWRTCEDPTRADYICLVRGDCPQ